MAHVLSITPLNISFRKPIVGQRLLQWYDLVSKIENINLTRDKDSFYCNLHANGLFSIRSMYQHMLNGTSDIQSMFIWKLKIPLKIKIFLWYVLRGVIVTNDNLTKRNWKGSQQCVFCTRTETIQHLIFDCQFAKFFGELFKFPLICCLF